MNFVLHTIFLNISSESCFVVRPGLSPPLLSFFRRPVVVRCLDAFVVVVVAVVASCSQFPVAFAERGVGLPPVEDLSPVGCRILVQNEKLKELDVAKEVPKVAIEHAPLVFWDQEEPDHQEGGEKGGEDEVFDSDDLLQVRPNPTAGKYVSDNNQRREKYEEKLSHSHQTSWWELVFIVCLQAQKYKSTNK